MRSVNEEKNIYLLLMQFSIRAKHQVMRLADRYDLSVMQLYTLTLIEETEFLPMNTISSKLVCDASNVTGIIERLLQLRYISKEESAEDRRVKLIALTETGKLVRGAIVKELDEQQFPGFAAIPASERAVFKKVLAQLLTESCPST